MTAFTQRRILWGLTGSVATIRADVIARELTQIGQVRTIVTQRAKHFLPTLPDSIDVYDDAREWSAWAQLGDPVVHIELRKWADVLLIAPASADCLAKLACGICDNLLLSVARAWEYDKPILIAPAMNTRMWEHPTTPLQLATLRSWGARIIDPVEKTLACADTGMGALATPDAVLQAVRGACGLV